MDFGFSYTADEIERLLSMINGLYNRFVATTGNEKREPSSDEPLDLDLLRRFGNSMQDALADARFGQSVVRSVLGTPRGEGSKVTSLT